MSLNFSSVISQSGRHANRNANRALFPDRGELISYSARSSQDLRINIRYQYGKRDAYLNKNCAEIVLAQCRATNQFEAEIKLDSIRSSSLEISAGVNTVLFYCLLLGYFLNPSKFRHLN